MQGYGCSVYLRNGPIQMSAPIVSGIRPAIPPNMNAWLLTKGTDTIVPMTTPQYSRAANGTPQMIITIRFSFDSMDFIRSKK